MITKKQVITNLLLITGIIILLNFIAYRFFIRLDFTEDRRYTLSEATKNILGSLDEPVTITAYFSDELPPDIGKVKKDFQDLLTEYDNNSGGKVLYRFINPNENQETEMEAAQSGIQPVVINVRERDQMKQQRAYLGAVIQYGEKKEVIPLIQPGSAMEYALSTAIKKLSLKEKIKIAFLQGNGEPQLTDMTQVNQQLSVMYDVGTFQLNDSTDIPAEYKTLIIVAPADTVKEDFLIQLDKFLGQGGRILFALNRVKGDLSTSSGSAISTGFEKWLSEKGINVKEEFLTDVNSGSVMVQQRTGMFVMNTPVNFPYIPVISKFADHPVTKGIESVIFPFVSTVEVSIPDTSIKVTNLALTSEQTGIEKPPVYFNVMREWTRNDFPSSSLPVAVALEGKLFNGTYSKMIVFGDGDFAVNGSGQNARKLDEDNVNLLVNAIDWLSDDTGLIDLRTKGVTSRPIDPDLEDSTKTFLKYLNFLLPVLLIITFGVIRYQYRKKLKNKWAKENYV
ncbi:MAG: Gldg family protein [Ignavibacteriaceae bacterium]